MMAKWVHNKIELPDDLSAKDRRAVGKELLEFIRKRTASGRGKGSGTFPKYSKEYTQSLDFRNARKSAGKVNLKLSGDMMAALDVLSHKKGQLIYGFKNKTEENDRAEGNILGSYGGSPNASKVRDFMGLDKNEVNAIVELSKSGILDRLKRGLSVTSQITLLPERVLKSLAFAALFVKKAKDVRKEDRTNSD